MVEDPMPLVSFCVMCCNNADTIGQAVAAALRQTYPAVEVLVSDDCSDDASMDIIHATIEGRKSDIGNRRVVVMRNETRYGRLGNWQRLVSEARGELLIKADGDDVSTVDRAEELVKAWLAGGKRATVLCSSGLKVDSKGNSYGPIKKGLACGAPLGAVACYSRVCYDLFEYVKDFAEVNASDDGVYGLRARILGEVQYVPKKLVLYRIGTGASTGFTGFRRRTLAARRRLLGRALVGSRDLAEAVRKGLIVAEKEKSVYKLIDNYKSLSLDSEILWGGGANS